MADQMKTAEKIAIQVNCIVREDCAIGESFAVSIVRGSFVTVRRRGRHSRESLESVGQRLAAMFEPGQLRLLIGQDLVHLRQRLLVMGHLLFNIDHPPFIHSRILCLSRRRAWRTIRGSIPFFNPVPGRVC
jgi:hypothetical protein